MLKKLGSSLVLLLVVCLCLQAQSPQSGPPVPPVAEKIPFEITTHGDTRVDPYYWLKDAKNPKVIEYLNAENEYTKQRMQHTEPLQAKLYQEMLSRIQETDLSLPEKRGDYYYYNRTEKGKQYPIVCRKKGSLEAEEKIILDINEVAKGEKYCDIGVLRMSPDHNLLAYSVDNNGSEVFTVYVKDIEKNALLSDKIENTYYGLEWANDNKTLFYTVLDAAKRPYQLYRHRLGTSTKEDVLMYHEKDEAFFLDISRTKSDAYLLMTLGSQVTSEVRYLKADDSDGAFQVFYPRKWKVEYSVSHRNDLFYIITNENAKNFKLLSVPVADIAVKNQKEVLPHRPEVTLEGMTVFADYLVIYERENGLKQFHVMPFTGEKDYRIDFSEPLYNITPAANKEFQTATLRFHFTSLITQESVYDYDMKEKTRKLQKQTEVKGYDPTQYEMKRLFAKAKDGASIPISMVYKKGVKQDGKNYLYLYGYGAYGINTDPGFSSHRLSLLDRGFIFAIAHIRGGGEMGREWYENGKFLQKKNTFEDFIASAEYLIAEKYTTKERLVIHGGSAGGLLVGAVTTMRPDLCEVVLAEVPFVDIVTTMLDETIPLTVIEFEEWGNPKDKTYYDYMKSYSPYDNVRKAAYPNMLVQAGLNDPRVPYWEPAKLVAKLRDMKTDGNRLLFKIDMGFGHGGASGRYDYLKEKAFQYAFILDCLKISQ